MSDLHRADNPPPHSTHRDRRRLDQLLGRPSIDSTAAPATDEPSLLDFLLRRRGMAAFLVDATCALRAYFRGGVTVVPSISRDPVTAITRLRLCVIPAGNSSRPADASRDDDSCDLEISVTAAAHEALAAFRSSWWARQPAELTAQAHLALLLEHPSAAHPPIAPPSTPPTAAPVAHENTPSC